MLYSVSDLILLSGATFVLLCDVCLGQRDTGHKSKPVYCALRLLVYRLKSTSIGTGIIPSMHADNPIKLAQFCSVSLVSDVALCTMYQYAQGTSYTEQPM